MQIIISYCPLCDNEHDLEKRVKFHACLIKNKKIEYLMQSLYCCNKNDEFWTEEMMKDNLNIARLEYKKLYEGEK